MKFNREKTYNICVWWTLISMLHHDFSMPYDNDKAYLLSSIELPRPEIVLFLDES